MFTIDAEQIAKKQVFFFWSYNNITKNIIQLSLISDH